MSRYPFHTLDVFTTKRFAGNPLAVVLNADTLSDSAMQTVAREFNLSETIFVRKPANPEHTASVRIFFPTAEIPFAGHPTIGCAILLAEMQNPGTANFDVNIMLEEVAGLVPVKVDRRSGAITAQFTAPVVPYPIQVAQITTELAAKALALEPAQIGFSGHEISVHEGGPKFLYIPVVNQQALGAITATEPYWSEMTGIADTGGVYVYRRDGEGRFRARMLAPTSGIPEDPATGSASALFASQLLQANDLIEGTNPISLEQGVEMDRESLIAMEIDVANGAIKAVRVAGNAVRVSEGTIEV